MDIMTEKQGISEFFTMPTTPRKQNTLLTATDLFAPDKSESRPFSDYLWEEEEAPGTYAEDPEEEEEIIDLFDDEEEDDGVHPWAFDDGEDDYAELPKTPRARGANFVRISSGLLLLASSAASVRLVAANTVTPLLAMLESETSAKHVSAIVLMGVEALPLVFGMLTALLGLALANHRKLAAVLKPLGTWTAFFSALPLVVVCIRNGFSLAGCWPYAFLLIASLVFLTAVKVLRSGNK